MGEAYRLDIVSKQIEVVGFPVPNCGVLDSMRVCLTVPDKQTNKQHIHYTLFLTMSIQQWQVKNITHHSNNT